MSIKEVFNNWIAPKVDWQLDAIDEINSELNIDINKFFYEFFLDRKSTSYTGTDFVREILPDFLFYLSEEMKHLLLEYVPASGKNVYGEPYISLDFELWYLEEVGLIVKTKDAKNFKKFMKKLTLDQKLELMKNNLFSHIVNKTNLKIFSKKNIRVLKLRNLNDYTGFDK